MRSFPRRTVAALVAGVLASFAVATPAFADAPVANDGTARVSTSQVIPIQLSEYVTPGFSGSYSIVSPPTTGQLATPDGSGNTTFTPDGSAQAGDTDSFQYQIDDGTDPTSTGTITLDYNNPPTADAVNQVVSPIDPTVVHLGGGGHDADGDSLTYAITQPPATGSLGTVSGSDVTFTPPGDLSGSVTFTYEVSDGVDTSAPATVTLNYDVASDAGPVTVAVSTDTTFNLAPDVIGATDPQRNYSYSVVSQSRTTTKGFVSFSGSVADFDPFVGGSNTASFTYRVYDGTSYSGTHTVSLVFNRPPTVATPIPGDSVSDPIRIPATHTSNPISLTASDSDSGQTLSYSVATQPTNGTVSLTGSNATVTPKPSAGALRPDQSHVDAFIYQVGDNYDTSTATVYVKYNRVPTASNDSINVVHGQSVTVDLNSLAADGDGDSLYFPTQDQVDPSHGTVIQSVDRAGNTTLTYTADLDFVGTDTMQYRSYDGYDHSAAATITFKVTDVAPQGVGVTVHTAYDASTSFMVHGSDADHDSLSYSPVGRWRANNGWVTLSKSGHCAYTPDPGFAGNDWFHFTASDGAKESTAKITIAVAKASTKITSAAFSPKRPTPGDSLSATVKVRTAGSPVAGIVVLHDGTKSYRGTMMGSSGTIYLHHLSAGTHHFTIDYLGTHTTAPTSTTATLKVAKIATKLKVSVKPKQLTTKKRGVAKVTVSAPHASVNGAVATISEGHKTLGRAVVRHGIAKITLPKLRLGQHNLTVRYAGTSSASSVTKKLVVRVSLG